MRSLQRRSSPPGQHGTRPIEYGREEEGLLRKTNTIHKTIECWACDMIFPGHGTGPLYETLILLSLSSSSRAFLLFLGQKNHLLSSHTTMLAKQHYYHHYYEHIRVEIIASSFSSSFSSEKKMRFLFVQLVASYVPITFDYHYGIGKKLHAPWLVLPC